MSTANQTLHRLPKQGQISGVCAGLAEFFEIDVTLLRLIFVILAIATGGGVIVLYIVLSIVIPADDQTTKPVSPKSSTKSKSQVDNDLHPITENVQQLSRDLRDNRGINKIRNYLGFGLLILGGWLLLGQFFPRWFNFRWDYIWPALLILVGFLIITRGRD